MTKPIGVVGAAELGLYRLEDTGRISSSGEEWLNSTSIQNDYGAYGSVARGCGEIVYVPMYPPPPAVEVAAEPSPEPTRAPRAPYVDVYSRLEPRQEPPAHGPSVALPELEDKQVDSLPSW